MSGACHAEQQDVQTVSTAVMFPFTLCTMHFCGHAGRGDTVGACEDKLWTIRDLFCDTNHAWQGEGESTDAACRYEMQAL
jgi:hypothetical protein